MEDMKVLNDKELVEVSGGSEISDHFEPGVIDYARDSSIMEDKKVLNNEELEKVSGGTDFADIPNPLIVQTEEEALKIAGELGNGKDMGTWKTMSGEEYMQLWRGIHKK